MSIRCKLALTVFMVVALFLATDRILRGRSFVDSLTVIERERVLAESDRVRDALDLVAGEVAMHAKRLEEQEAWTTAAVVVLFPLTLLLLIHGLVTGPLRRLTEHATEIGRSDDASKRLGLRSRDEIGLLAREFDRMLEKLERSRVDQQRIARFAGRSEIAVGVMHNVGNLANSLGVAAGLGRDRFSAMDAGDLRAIHEELVSHRGDLDRYLARDARGKHLLDFLGAIVARLDDEIADARQEAEAVVDGVRRIADLVAALEEAKSGEPIVERVDVAKEIESALRLAVSSANVEVEVVQDVENAPGIVVDRQRLHETLVAIMSNGIDAMEAQPVAERFLVVCAEPSASGRVRIAIRDFGVGIERHALRRIFAPGVSTKAGGSGFGLHLASLAVKELGGTLEAASDGPTTGATFTIDLPPLPPREDEAERTAA